MVGGGVRLFEWGGTDAVPLSVRLLTQEGETTVLHLRDNMKSATKARIDRSGDGPLFVRYVPD
jgi:hypothetical protein